ncbi:DUF6090 family protein [Flavobacteriaceae sp. LMIT009]
MIKFFRRIRKKLLTENKFSKYMGYALGEILLVVIGILIALAANNWNIDQNNAKAEIKLLQQLELEYSENLSELIQNIQLREDMIASAYSLRNYFINGAEGVALDSLEKHRALTYYNIVFNAPDGTTSLLLNSGELNLIQDGELKIRLSNWKGTIKEMTEQESFVTNHLLPQYFNYTNYNYDAIKLAGSFDQMKDKSFTDPIGKTQNVKEDQENLISYSASNKDFQEWSKWLEDKTIINYVLQISTRNKIANSKALEVKNETERILELIKQNLED